MPSRRLARRPGQLVAEPDDSPLGLLEWARAVRRSLPVGASLDTPLVELRVPVPNRPGVIAEVTTLGADSV